MPVAAMTTARGESTTTTTETENPGTTTMKESEEIVVVVVDGDSGGGSSSPALGDIAPSIGADEINGSHPFFPRDDDENDGEYEVYREGFYIDGEDDDDGLIHIPLRSRASVLAERRRGRKRRQIRVSKEYDGAGAGDRTNNYRVGGEEGEEEFGYDDDDDLPFGEEDSVEEYLDEDAPAAFERFARHYPPLGDGDGHSSDGRRSLQAAGDGAHFMDVFIGNPAQHRVLAVSTGADFTSFPCKECTECGAVRGFFRQDFSSTFSTIPCGQCVGGQREDVCDADRRRCVARGVNLLDKSAWEAYEARDLIYVGGADIGNLDPEGTDVPKKHGFPLVFACQTLAKGWFETEVHDGIVSFSTARTSFINQMVFQGKIAGPRFSMCFVEHVLSGSVMHSAGVVTLGGYNPKILNTPMVYVQNFQDSDAGYTVHIRKMYIREGGGKSIVPDRDNQQIFQINFDPDLLNSKNGGTVIDSVVPMLVLDGVIEEAFRKEWKRITKEEFSFGKKKLTDAQLLAMPTLILQIKAHEGVDKSFDPRTVPSMAGDDDPDNPFDVLFAIPSSRYMRFNPTTGTYRPQIVLDSKLGSFIGMNCMLGHSIVFDLRQDRIGIAESHDCKNKGASYGGSVDDDQFGTPIMNIDTDQYGGSSNDNRDSLLGGLGSSRSSTTNNAADGGSVGPCTTATCISFVTVGYVIVVAVLAVAYKMYRPKDQSKHWDHMGDNADIDNNGVDNDFDDEFDENDETVYPEFEQHIRHRDVNGFV